MAKRNLDTAASPGPKYEAEPDIVHGSTYSQLPKKRPKLRQQVPDTRSRLPYRPPAEGPLD